HSLVVVDLHARADVLNTETLDLIRLAGRHGRLAIDGPRLPGEAEKHERDPEMDDVSAVTPSARRRQAHCPGREEKDGGERSNGRWDLHQERARAVLRASLRSIQEYELLNDDSDIEHPQRKADDGSECIEDAQAGAERPPVDGLAPHDGWKAELLAC